MKPWRGLIREQTCSIESMQNMMSLKKNIEENLLLMGKLKCLFLTHIVANIVGLPFKKNTWNT